MSVYDKLSAIGISLPSVTPSVAEFVPFVRTGNLIFVSGHIARRNGEPWVGRARCGTTTADGREAARGIAIELLGRAPCRDVWTSTGSAASSKLLVLVNSAPTFTEPHLVANGASELFDEVFGDRGTACTQRHRRRATAAGRLRRDRADRRGGVASPCGD